MPNVKEGINSNSKKRKRINQEARQKDCIIRRPKEIRCYNRQQAHCEIPPNKGQGSQTVFMNLFFPEILPHIQLYPPSVQIMYHGRL